MISISKKIMLLTLFSLYLCNSQTFASNSTISSNQLETKEETHSAWWKEAVFYQIYIRSFKDSNGDGIGDIKGIIQKLDYLKNLGINAIWITPHYDSPNKDSGYDIRDYKKIMSEYGTMDDFDQLISEMKKRNMRLMIDVVINHTSDENSWFVESKKSKNSAYRNYYFWKDNSNNYPSIFGGSAWKKDIETDQYYLHYFSESQPDLNWDNPNVRNDLYQILRFWLDKGVSGLRFDTVATYSKIPNFPNLTSKQLNNFAQEYTKGPNIHNYIQEMNQKVLSKYDIATAGEIFGVPLRESINFFDRRRKELNIAFTFDLIKLDRYPNAGWNAKKWNLSDFRKTIDKVDETAGKYGWNAFFLDNHDNNRAVSHFGNDNSKWRDLSAKALATIMFTQRATPFIYQGSELGMTNYPFKKINQFEDIEVKNQWKYFVQTGKVSPEKYIKNIRITSRDNSRTPVQWDSTKNAGFTTGKPWFVINPNYKEINADRELRDNQSVLNYYRKIIEIRHNIPALVYGVYHDIDSNNNEVYGYTRTLKNEKYLILVNFKEYPVKYDLPNNITVSKKIIQSSSITERKHKHATNIELGPWSSVIYKI